MNLTWMKKCAALGFALCLMGTTACGRDSVGQEQNTTELSQGITTEGLAATGVSSHHGLTLAYTATDVLNPYTAKTKANQELCTLLYEGLVRVDNEYAVENRLAQKVEGEGSNYTVTLRQAFFSDGSVLTADDVVYSYRNAAAQGSRFASVLQGVSVSAASSTVVRFRLSSPDPYFSHLLDIPIVKLNSLKRESEDNKALPPTGCGRYIFQHDSGGYFLKANSACIDPPTISKITLLNLPDQSAVVYNAGAGLLDYYYTDLSDNMLPKMNGLQVQVNLNHLVFIGIRCQKSPLRDVNVRKGLNLAVSRSAVVENAFFAGATPATGLYHPSFAPTREAQTIRSAADTEGAIDAFAQAGYVAGADGVLKKQGKALELSLLYNEENDSHKTAAQLISSQLKKVGVSVKLRGRSYSAYQSAARSGDFDLYVGEMRIAANMDLTPLLSLTGVSQSGQTWCAYEDFKNGRKLGESQPATAPASATPSTEEGTTVPASTAAPAKEATVTDVCAAFSEEIPLIPVCYRNGILTYSSKISGTVVATRSDLYYTISMCGYDS